MAEDRSTIGVAPASALADANKLYNSIGHGGDQNFGAKLSANGQEPATHYAYHSWETPERATLKQSMAGENAVLPEIEGEWDDYGLTEQTAMAAAQSLDVSVRVPSASELQNSTAGEIAVAHFNGMIAGMGLQRVIADW